MDQAERRYYPSRCHPATHAAHHLPANAGEICLHGRLVKREGDRGWLQSAQVVVAFRMRAEATGVAVGDIVQLRGHAAAGELYAEHLELLAGPREGPWDAAGDWQRFSRRGGRQQENLAVRAQVLSAIRAFFAGAGFLEVETPALVVAPGQEAHLQVFETRLLEAAPAPHFLVTSPEHHMKRLLGGGLSRIFQICRCFRNGERSRIHSPEFTMVEWYRAYASLDEVMADVEQLVRHVCRTVSGRAGLVYQGVPVELAPAWRRLTVAQAFERYAGVVLPECRTADELRRRARTLGFASARDEDSWEDLFYKLLVERVEPALVALGPVLLAEYPACMAAMAKLKETDPSVAERAEVYIAGLELANGFTELNDPAEQRRRFADECRKRNLLGYPALPLDREFLRMMEQGMPPAGGMALGVDRLVMLLTDAAAIGDVIAFPSGA